MYFLYSDPCLGQVRRKSVVKSRLIYAGPAPDDRPEPSRDAHTDNPDEGDDDELELDELLGDEIEEEDYIDGVDTTYYLCPKCNRFTLEKTGGSFLTEGSFLRVPGVSRFGQRCPKQRYTR